MTSEDEARLEGEERDVRTRREGAGACTKQQEICEAMASTRLASADSIARHIEPVSRSITAAECRELFPLAPGSGHPFAAPNSSRSCRRFFASSRSRPESFQVFAVPEWVEMRHAELPDLLQPPERLTPPCYIKHDGFFARRDELHRLLSSSTAVYAH